MTSNPFIDVQAVSIRFGARIEAGCVVSDFSQAICEREVLALVGESGSGKTILSRALLGLLPEQAKVVSGSILVEGRRLDKFSQDEWRRYRGAAVGMVFQEPLTSLNPALRIGVQLEEGLRLHTDLSADARFEACLNMLQRVRLPNPERALRSYPHEFSGGMRQRIMLAAVMLLKPRLLIADEPTTALDVIVQREVLDLMVDIVRDTGAGLLLITHDLGVVADYADRVVVLEHGRIAEAGKCERILKSPSHNYTRRLLGAIPRDQRTARPVDSEKDAPLVDARDIRVTYPVPGTRLLRRDILTAVDGVSLSIAAGQTVGLVGESGSGKSSLGRALLQLVPVADGSMRFAGEELVGLEARDLGPFRRRMQLVFQDPFSSLDPRMRVQDIVGEGLRFVRPGNRFERKTAVCEMLREVELDPSMAERFPHELSGGQRQRVCIARALIMSPDLIVADEPVSALDVTVQAQVLKLIARLQVERGFACLFISHDLAVVREVADQVAVMYGGCMIEEGPNAAVFDRPAHPYTRALLAATPMLYRDQGASDRPKVPLPPPFAYLSTEEIDTHGEAVARRSMKVLGPGHRVAVVESTDVRK